MGTRPEEIRSEIEETRDRISAEIDELADRYSPGRVAGRKASGARDAAVSARSKVGSGLRARWPRRGGETAPYPSDVARTGGQVAEAADHRATVASGSDYAAPGSAASYRPEAAYPRHPSGAATDGQSHRPGAPGLAEGDASRRRPDEEVVDQHRFVAGTGRHERRGRAAGKDLGLLGASLVVGALGARRVLHPGGREQSPSPTAVPAGETC